MSQQIISSQQIDADLLSVLNNLDYNGLYLVMDANSERYCFPELQSLPRMVSARTIVLPAGEEFKDIRSVERIWFFLSENGATRKSLVINLGGGMLTDLGGFAAATFKRGLRFINIPTTLLGAVDAAVGGKTGFNFNGLKNEIGVFAPAIAVLIHAPFFRSLDRTNLLSGYAEMLKHALLNSSDSLMEALRFDPDRIDYSELNRMLFESVLVKKEIVEKDPEEQHIRKALNLGHTFGHAFESLSHRRGEPAPHGYAVAWGLICELYLSFVRLGFDPKLLTQLTRYIREHWGRFSFDCNDYDFLCDRMKHDKKNDGSSINFTLLKSPGEIVINQTATASDIIEALDYYLMG